MSANQKIGNIVKDLKRGILVQQVNAQGVMASGVAKELREAYPAVLEDYALAVGPLGTQTNRGQDLLGTRVWSRINDDLWICSLVSQQFYGRKAGHRYTSYDALDTGFSYIAIQAKHLNLPVHYPLIGCGLGGGDWSIVSAIIEKNLGTIDHTLWTLPR